MAFLSSNLSATWTQQRLTCVLDPSLALSVHGLSLAKHLSQVMELWIVRELWHILDNIYFYQQHPELLPASTTLVAVPDIEPANRQEIIQALQDWELARLATDPVNLNLFWIGDRPGESFLPAGTELQLIRRWEFLARSLDEQLDNYPLNRKILAFAFRDAAALAVALRSTFILTYQLPKNNTMNLPPRICTVLESWGIPCQAIDPLDAIASIERENLRHLLVQAGLSKFLWAGLHLAVLHLVVPSAAALGCGVERTQEIRSFEGEAGTDSTPNLWQGARGFWYSI